METSISGNSRLPVEEEQNQEEEQEEEVQADPREGLKKIIDRERGLEGKLSNAWLLCAICGSSELKKAKKKVFLQKGVFIKDALKVTGRLCKICYKEVRKRKLAEGKTVIQVLGRNSLWGKMEGKCRSIILTFLHRKLTEKKMNTTKGTKYHHWWKIRRCAEKTQKEVT